MSDDSLGSIAARNERGADRGAESDRRAASDDWRPRVIVSDMDGTLLRGDDTVSPATVAELERWRADGVPVILATGRPPRWMGGIREGLGSGPASRWPRPAAPQP